MRILFILLCMALSHASIYTAELDARVLSIYSNDKQNESFPASTALHALVNITNGTAPFTIMWNGKQLGQTKKRLLRLRFRAVAEPGTHAVPVTIIDAQQQRGTCQVRYQISDPNADEDWDTDNTEQASGDLSSLLSQTDDWGDEDDEETEDVADPYLSSGQDVYPWTENQSRAIMNTMLPSAVAIGDNAWYYRILHVARERIDDEPATNFIGLDDNVKIGFQVCYGLSPNIDVNIQRVNGRALQVNLNRSESTKMDYYDVIFRYQFFRHRDGDLMDAAVHIGPTFMLRNTGSGEESLNLGLICEKNFFQDRLRLGAGLAYASLSTYERTIGKGPDTKLTPDEYAALEAAGSPVPAAVDDDTLAIPLMVKYALSKKQQLFAEVIVPIDGYETRAGPSIAAGYRLNSNTHEYSVYLTNTGNPSYNGTITGGHDYDEINLFGFFISAYF